MLAEQQHHGSALSRYARHAKYVRYAMLVWFITSLAGCATQPKAGVTPCTAPLDARVLNGCIVEPQTLWRGAKPDARAATALVEAGVRTVVNLELLLDDKAAFAAATPSIRASQTIQYFRLRDWEPLVAIAPSVTDDHVAHFIAITRTQTKPIYVHCRSGQNRTGVIVAAYKIFNGANIEATITEMAAYGGFWAKQDSDYLRGFSADRLGVIQKNVAKWETKLKADAFITCANGRCAAQ